MWRDGHRPDGSQSWRCRVKETARNAGRIRVGGDGGTFVGRAHQFGASKQDVKRFIDTLRKESHGADV